MKDGGMPAPVRCIIALFIMGIALLPLAATSVMADGPLTLLIHSVSTADFPQVRVYMTATDSSGRLVQPASSDLILADSGQLTRFTGVQAAGGPVALVLLLDHSRRNGEGWLTPVGAESGPEFLKRISGHFLDNFSEGHLVQVIGYDKTEEASLRLESDVSRVKERLAAIEVQEATLLYERIDRALDLLRGAESAERKILVVASDGNDVHSLAVDQNTIRTLSDKANAHQINIHAIGAGRLTDQWLRTLATETKGSFRQPISTLQLGQAFEAVRDTLRSQFIVTYQAPCTGQPHTVVATSQATGGARDIRPYMAGETGPRIQFDGAQIAGDVHHVTLTINSICPLQQGSIRLELGGARSVSPILQNGDKYFFSFNPVSLGLDAGSHRASVVAHNGIETRLEEAYEFWVKPSEFMGVPASALPFFLFSGGVLFLGGAGVLLRESRKPRAIDAFLEYSPDPDEPEVWRPGTSFWLRSVTRIGRSGDADIEVPPSVTDIPWPGVRLLSRERNGALWFKVVNEGESRGLNVWVGHNPLSQDNDILRPGEMLFVGGLAFTLRTRLKTGAAAATTGSY